MDVPIAFSELPSFAVWLARFCLLFTIAFFLARSSRLQGSLIGIVAALSCITPLALSWLLTVTENVPEPYLDEIFHIPQAQVYCRGGYLEWDDKITTPPGLYISTIVFNRILGLPCSFYNLRAFNVFVISCISVLVILCKPRSAQSSSEPDTGRQVLAHDIVTGVNVAFFPVLFFFSGLYYTDPASTLIVLVAYENHLARVGTKQVTFLNDVYSLGLGILALGFRQTNIFWVVVYMGGLEVIHSIKHLHPAPVETPTFRTVSEQLEFYARRYSLGDIHDPPLSLTQPIDVVLCAISIGIAAICNLPTVFSRFVWPHGVVLATFAAFVTWNGGVVLGDKSNHVATLHLAQMLYIWPVFAFFSAPLFVPQLLNLASKTCQTLLSQARQQTPFFTPDIRAFSPSHPAIKVLISCCALLAILAVVRFNTIIHPFTLADNRHYVFYVFRYSILRAWWVRYALAPVYIFCAWLCWGVLQGDSFDVDALSSPHSTHHQAKWILSPFTAAAAARPSSPLLGMNKGEGKEGAAGPAPRDGQRTAETESRPTSPPTSTVLMLLLTTALSLMTAPLVEPRYFILPWVFWRLLVPSTPVLLSSSSSAQTSVVSDDNRSSSQSKRQSGQSRGGGCRSGNYIYILLLEMAWFALINAATMYVFVTRPFYWRTPDGTLQDEGRVQRFMW